MVLGVPLAGGSPAGTLGGPPPLPCCARWVRADGWGFPLSLPPPLCPLALGVHDRSGGDLSSVSPSARSVSSRSLLGVSSPPSSLCMSSSAGAGPALTRPPADAAVAAPMDCAVGCPAPPSLSSSVGAGPAVTGPPTDTPTAAPVGCAFGCPVPPARSSVPISASTSCRPIGCAR